jgi:hypothetical protein
VDTKAFLLRRDALRDQMASVRAYSLAAMKRHGPWWLTLPIVPLAGFFAMRGHNGHTNGESHPIVKSFLIAGARRLVRQLVKRWGLEGWLDKPSLLQRLFA